LLTALIEDFLDLSIENYQMEEFTLKGGGDYLKITISEVFGFPETTCFNGGYDTKSSVEIYSDGFKAHATIWFSTGEVFELYNQLLKANNSLTGVVYFAPLENNLEFNAEYDNNGRIIIKGELFKVNDSCVNRLKFEFKSDQSYIQSTLMELEIITNKYGGMKGIKV